MRLKFKRLENGRGLPLPAYATAGSAAMDVCSAEDVVLKEGSRVLIQTGFAVEVPEGYELQVRPRSGLALKQGITIPNTPGTIDSDYRGEICVILHKYADTPSVFGSTLFATDLKINRGDRIAQLVLAPITQAVVEEVEELSDTARGAGGFGSTGNR